MSVHSKVQHTHEAHVWLAVPSLKTSLSHLEAFVAEVRRVGGTDATEVRMLTSPGQLATTVAQSCPEPADAAHEWSEVERKWSGS